MIADHLDDGAEAPLLWKLGAWGSLTSVGDGRDGRDGAKACCSRNAAGGFNCVQPSEEKAAERKYVWMIAGSPRGEDESER